MLVMAFSVTCIAWYDPALAFNRANFYLHIICPIMIVLSFFMVESNYSLDQKDNLFSMIPFAIYAFAYLINVVILRRWKDLYMLNTLLPFYITMPLMFLLAYSIGWLIRSLYNRQLAYREKKLKLIWDEDLDPVSVRIKIYSLGFHAGLYEEKADVSIPFDILEDISERFDIRKEDLAKVFTKGAIDGIKEKERKKK